MRKKNEAFSKFKEFKARIETYTVERIKIAHFDNAEEFLLNEFLSYIKEQGIEIHTKVPHSSEQNLAELGHDGRLLREEPETPHLVRCLEADDRFG